MVYGSPFQRVDLRANPIENFSDISSLISKSINHHFNQVFVSESLPTKAPYLIWKNSARDCMSVACTFCSLIINIVFVFCYSSKVFHGNLYINYFIKLNINFNLFSHFFHFLLMLNAKFAIKSIASSSVPLSFPRIADVAICSAKSKSLIS